MSHDALDTEELLRRCSGGDHQATNALFERHRQQLARMVQVRMDPRVRGRVDPSDVIQETLVLASQRLGNYMSERPIPFYPWLRQIAWEKLLQEHKRHLHTHKRSVRRETQPCPQVSEESVSGLTELLMGPTPTPSEHAIRGEVRARVRRGLERLAELDREVLLLRYLEQMPAREIAVIVGGTVGAVNMRLMRALERMRKVLDAQS